MLGALSSHRVAERLGERRALLGCLSALLALHASLALSPSPAAISVAFPLIGALQRLKWPLVESYASAGRHPRALLSLIGKYNVSWALAIPLALTVAGALIDRTAHRHFFALPALLNVFALAVVRFWPARPARLADDHPQRPDQASLGASVRLLSSARWTMLSSYLLLFLLAPLMPRIFERLDVPVRLATSAAALLDGLRLSTFALLGAWSAARPTPAAGPGRRRLAHLVLHGAVRRVPAAGPFGRGTVPAELTKG